MGTPDFAVLPLQRLLDTGHNVVAVVTNPDKPAGRGQKLQESAVKRFAVERGIPVLQPERFRDEAFLASLRALEADLQLVVAFKMLPEVVWNMPPMGTVNLHASLLPDYRGAAPIQWSGRDFLWLGLLESNAAVGAVCLRRELARSAPARGAACTSQRVRPKNDVCVAK